MKTNGLEIVSADSFSDVFLFSFFLFFLFLSLIQNSELVASMTAKNLCFFSYHFDLATVSNEKTQCMLVVRCRF